ncbi:MAG: TetR family transcriptional regulator [Burkholderiaceae bacterium]|jgi:AcrR family transcriptional regulator|nr:TetR family transcriptional regulator [Burkholderiaceae bacterium]
MRRNIHELAGWDRDRNPTEARRRRARLAPEIESAVLDLAFRHPNQGQDRVSRDLRASGINVSASGVRYIWQRHNLETLHKRVVHIRSRLGSNDRLWSKEQLAARDRLYRPQESNLNATSPGDTPVHDGSQRSMHILSMAAALIREQGFENITLRDIAKKAQIPFGSIYYHFQSKEELFTVVYEEGLRRLQGLLDDAIRHVADPWERLEKACACHLVSLLGGDDFTAISVPLRMPMLAKPARRRIDALNDAYEGRFRELIKALTLAPRVSKTLLRLHLLGAMNWSSTWYRPGQHTPAEIAAQLLGNLRYGTSLRTPSQ